MQASLPCDRCSQLAPRFSTAERVAIDLHLDAPVLLLVTVSVHYCPACHHYFRAQPPFLRPDGVYTQRVVQTAVQSVYQDRMAMRRVPDRLARDFWVQPSEGSIRQWCRAYQATFTFETDYQPWVIAAFSGILCVDEVYQDDLALLLAVDPAAPDGDRLIGYQLVHGTIDAARVTSFLAHLKDLGIDPEQVITDGSALYPSVLTKLWPHAAHQLCLFHETRRVTKAVLEVIQDIRRLLPTPPRTSGNLHWGGRWSAAPPTDNPADAATQRWHARQARRHAGIAAVHRLARQGFSYRAIGRHLKLDRRTVKAWLALDPVAASEAVPGTNWYDVQMPTPSVLRQQHREATRATIRHLAQQGFSYTTIAQYVNLHRVTVSKWLNQDAQLPSTAQAAAPADAPPDSAPIADAALPPPPWSDWEAVRQTQGALQDDRFLFVHQAAHLTTDEQHRMQRLYESPIGAHLTVARAFLEEWYGIWRTEQGERPTLAEAQARYTAWQTNPTYGTVPALRRVQARVTPAQFAKLSHFLRHPHWEATNNGAERGGRAFRHLQGPHYNLRSEASIKGAIAMLARQHQQRAQQQRRGGTQASRGRKPRLQPPQVLGP